MRKIGIVLRIIPSGGGTWQWTINILNALQDYSKTNQCEINLYYFNETPEYRRIKTLFPDFIFYKFGKMARMLGAVLRKIFIVFPFTIKVLRHIYPLNLRISRDEIDLMIFPGASLDPAFCLRRHIFMFGDISHVFFPHFPEVSADGELRRRNLIFQYGIANADQIVVESRQLGKDIIKYYRADSSKIEVLYQVYPKATGLTSPDKTEALECIEKLPEQYLFYPAQLWEHKNHLNLLKALSILLPGFPNLHLVLVGSRKKGDEAIFRMINNLTLREHVRYLGYVPDSWMPILYKKAQALVMPTYFGPTNIPTLEAFNYGCPAVISKLPGAVEQTGDAALLFDPDSPKDIADKVRLTFNQTIRNELIRKGFQRSRNLSYEGYRDTFFKILDKNLGRSI
jgi:glycosyltransferase involved in cell wall biosynthesis